MTSTLYSSGVYSTVPVSVSVYSFTFKDTLSHSHSQYLVNQPFFCSISMLGWSPKKTKISYHWENQATRCITANVLQTSKVDTQCDKLATYLSWQWCVKSRRFSATAPAFNLPHMHLVATLGLILYEFCQDFQHRKTRVLGYHVTLFAWSYV